MSSFYRSFLVLFISLCWLETAGAQAVTYRYFRWIPTAFRDFDRTLATNGGIHISEFEFQNDGVRIPGATVTQIDGNVPSPDEVPQSVYDNSVDTKWFDLNRQPLIFDFGSEVTVNGYNWATANAADWRDPVQWLVQGSDDALNWVTIDDRTGADQTVTTARKAFFDSSFEFNSAVQVDFTISFDGLTGGSLNVPSGGEVTLNWTVANATSATLTGVTSPPNPLLQTSATDNPTATKTYTLSATNGFITVTKEVTAFVGESAEPLVINEFLAESSEEGVLCDEDGDASDWIEIYNPNVFVTGLGGLFLTTDPTKADRWQIPAGTTLDGESYLVIFASGKAGSVTELRSDFTLDSTPGYLAILDSDGSTVIDEINYPQQQGDFSYGEVSTGGLNVFSEPTPGTVNDTVPGPLAPAVEILLPSQSFTSTLSVPLSTSSASAEIYYTLNGSIPVKGEANTILYMSSVAIPFSATLRARAYQNGFAPGPVTTESYIKIETSVTDLSYELPVIVIDNFNGGQLNAAQQMSSAAFTLFEPDSVTGMTNLIGTPAVANRVGVNILKSTGDAKLSYRVQFREQGSDNDQAVELMNLSSDSEWILDAPYAFDRTLIRFPFIHQLSNEVGIYAPRTRLVEVYFNTTGNVEAADYRGIYSLQENVNRNPERVAVERLRKTDREAPELEGGYILQIGRPLAGDTGFRSAADQPRIVNNDSRPFYTFVDPAEGDLDPSQETYIKGYLDDLETALFDANFTDPVNGYRKYLDVDSAIDFHLLTAFAKDPDSLRLKAFLVKDRGEKLKFGPISNMERGFSASTDERSSEPDDWDPINLTPATTRGWAPLREYHWWGRLFEDPDFAQAYNDRWEELRQGEFSNTSMMMRVDDLAAKIMDFQARNFGAFGPNQPEADMPRDFAEGVLGWQGEVNHFRGWVTARADWMDTQLIATFPPNLDAGGSVTSGTIVNFGPNGGVMYYTTNGLDPRESGGGIRMGVITQATAGTLEITETTTIFARSLLGGVWSAPRISTFVVGGIGGAYEQWKASFFSPAQLADPTISGDTADPDEDGIANLLEFGLDLNPLEDNAPPFIDTQIQELSVDGNTSSYFTITYTRRTTTAGVQVVPEFSDNLENPWGGNSVLVSTNDLGNGTEEVVYRDSLPLQDLGAKRFARIGVQTN